MATVTSSIGTSSRDYSTIAAWEADIANIANNGDDVIGECYNDSVFSDINVHINISGLIPATVTLTAPESERHDGTAGSGVRIQAGASASYMMRINEASSVGTVEWLEFDGQDQDINRYFQTDGSGTKTAICRKCIFHNLMKTTSGQFTIIDMGFTSTAASTSFLNNIIYDSGSAHTVTAPAYGIYIDNVCTVVVSNNTIYDWKNDNGSGLCYGIYALVDDAKHSIRNNIITGPKDGTSSGTELAINMSAGTTNVTIDYNAVDDTSSIGANSIDNVDPDDCFVSTVGGSEDLHQKAGSPLIGQGVDLGTTDGVNFDIDEYDRDANGVTWDIGAHQFIAGAVSLIKRSFTRGVLRGYRRGMI